MDRMHYMHLTFYLPPNVHNLWDKNMPLIANHKRDSLRDLKRLEHNFAVIFTSVFLICRTKCCYSEQVVFIRPIFLFLGS